MSISPKLRSRAGTAGLALAVAYAAVALTVHFSPAVAEDDIFFDVDPPRNNYRVYLSRAFHTDQPGAQGECNAPYSTPRTERDMSFIVALAAANGSSGGASLVDRHYIVRMGRGNYDVNTARSNAWNSDLHIPMHSNATGNNPPCATDAAGVRGSVMMYAANRDGEALADHLKTRLNSETPGTNDKSCTDNQCSGGNLYELTSIDARRAAYSETEFHDWNRGTRFLHDRTVWYWRIGWAIDELLDYPRG